MRTVTFDFSTIHSFNEFYQQFANKFILPDYFGENLDALWDVVTSGEIGLPIKIVFQHLSKQSELQVLAVLFEQAQEEMHGDLVFRQRCVPT